MVKRWASAALVAIAACTFGACVSWGSVRGIVPATADQDAQLSRTKIQVAGADRWVHWQRFGPEGAPTLLVLHGSLGDHRAWLALEALSDEYQVVFWDQRGNGLSERIPEAEYTRASIIEEIDAIADAVSPDRPVSMIGHSFGAMYTSLYLSNRPDRVREAVLIEPGGLNGDIFAATFDEIINVSLFDPETNALFWQSEQVGAIDHEAADYRALMMLTNGKQTNYHCDADHPPPWPVWRPGAAVEIYRSRLLGSDSFGSSFNFDFAAGAQRFQKPILLLASSCSALGAKYQRKWHVPLFSNASVVEVPNVGHRLIQEDPDAVIAALRGYLAEYQRT